MNTNKTVLSIVDKLKPAKKTVELSIVNDIDSSFDFLEQSYSEASFGVDFMKEWEQKIYDFSTELSIAVDNYVINGAAYNFQEEAENMQARIDELEAKAEELGIEPSDLISNYDEIKDILNNADSVDTEFRNAYREVLQASNNLPLADFS